MDWKHFPDVLGNPWFARSRDGLIRITVEEAMGPRGHPDRQALGTLSLLNRDGDWKPVASVRGPVYSSPVRGTTPEDSRAQVLLVLKGLADYAEGT